MSRISADINAMRTVYDKTHRAYISLVDSWRVVIRADGTGNRRQRASQIGALKRALEQRHRCSLTYDHVNYSEATGFLSCTEVWYKLADPDAKFEAREFGSISDFPRTHGLACITVYPTRAQAEAHKPHGGRSLQVFEVRD